MNYFGAALKVHFIIFPFVWISLKAFNLISEFQSLKINLPGALVLTDRR